MELCKHGCGEQLSISSEQFDPLWKHQYRFMSMEDIWNCYTNTRKFNEVQVVWTNVYTNRLQRYTIFFKCREAATQYSTYVNFTEFLFYPSFFHFCHYLLVLICGALRDLVPFVQFKKQPWRSVTFSVVAGFSLQLY